METGRNKELAGNKEYPPITVADIQNGKTVFAARTPEIRAQISRRTRADPGGGFSARPGGFSRRGEDRPRENASHGATDGTRKTGGEPRKGKKMRKNRV